MRFVKKARFHDSGMDFPYIVPGCEHEANPSLELERLRSAAAMKPPRGSPAFPGRGLACPWPYIQSAAYRRVEGLGGDARPVGLGSFWGRLLGGLMEALPLTVE